MHCTNGRHKWSGSAMSGSTGGGLAVGRDGRASRIRGEVETGRSERTQTAGQSLARAGWRPQFQPAGRARSSTGRARAQSDRKGGELRQAGRVRTGRIRARQAQPDMVREAGEARRHAASRWA